MIESQAHCVDASDCLLQLGQAYIRFADEDPHRWAMVFEHRFSQAQVVPAWYQEKIERMFALVEEGLQPIAKQHTHAEITQASRALWGGVHGICILHTGDKLYSDHIASPRSLLHSLVKHYLHSWASEGKR